MDTYSKELCENLETFKGAAKYRERLPFTAIKVTGPFKVYTDEGLVECEDGFLCRDEDGYPFPVSTKVFNLLYKEDTNDA